MKIVLSTLLFALTLTSAHAKTLVEQAYEAGTLDLGTALIYQVQGARNPDSLPAEYRQQPLHAFCGTPHIVEAVDAMAHLDSDYRQRLGKLVQRRPSADLDVVSRS